MPSQGDEEDSSVPSQGDEEDSSVPSQGGEEDSNVPVAGAAGNPGALAVGPDQPRQVATAAAAALVELKSSPTAAWSGAGRPRKCKYDSCGRTVVNDSIMGHNSFTTQRKQNATETTIMTSGGLMNVIIPPR